MKTIPNSPTHRVLKVLSQDSSTPSGLHRQTKTHGQSLTRWGVEVMEGLVQRKLIRQEGHVMTITNAGLELFYDLERRSNVDVKRVALPREKPLLHTPEVYNPKNDMRPMREGAQDFLNYPSRVGNELVYRSDAVREEV